MSFQIDGRFGGKFFAGTHRAIQLNGNSAETVVNGERNNFVVDGVIQENNGYSNIIPKKFHQKTIGLQ
ncbi:hypothetical protein [Sphingobacterium daejeonense]|uniref:hypothetical protein n=1 Tax=Sphingobacterium daejeonense TaxID=371142 RepID=UPI0010C43E4E|nr:hypothetical protein [Sphingobacterium daejeonense]VTP88858.1 Uncharacterised protein [Sphingobacterium daejeonense]